MGGSRLYICKVNGTGYVGRIVIFYEAGLHRCIPRTYSARCSTTVYAALIVGTLTPVNVYDTRELSEPFLDLVVTLAPSGHMHLCLSSGSAEGAGRDIIGLLSVPDSHP